MIKTQIKRKARSFFSEAIKHNNYSKAHIITLHIFPDVLYYQVIWGGRPLRSYEI